MNRCEGWEVLLITGFAAGCVLAGPVGCGAHEGQAEGTAPLTATQPGSTVVGMATFVDTPKGLQITIDVAGAPPGLHGLHIHEEGACGDGGNAAGGHFNPDKANHGFLPKDGFVRAHAGDLGNIEVGANGSGTLALTLPGLTLRDGPHAVNGRSVILHEKPDDFGQPTGNAGGRIACGIIEISP